jgi:cobalt-zinc-cadmium resistance protein CzcA
VVLASLGAIALGIWSLARLPVDAVPDITNKQVQVNTTAFALSPAEIEKQVTFRIETALAGIPGLDSTRSISRNGFSQVTAVFTEKTDIYLRASRSANDLSCGPTCHRASSPRWDRFQPDSAKSICGR